MTSELSLFQGAFTKALSSPSDSVDGPFGEIARQPGFAVYRNTVHKACIDALQANFSAIVRLVGEDWFRGAASVYHRAEPPKDARLLLYGATFPAFLAQFPPAAELPYLCGVALLDRFWIEAHTAADARVLDAQVITHLQPEQLRQTVVRLHPAARWSWFSGQPIRSLWESNRGHDAISGGERKMLWESEGILISRPFAEVIWTDLEPGGVAFLDSCAAGRTIEDAVSSAVETQPALDLAKLIAKLLDAGCLSSMEIQPTLPVQKAFP